MMIGKDSVTLVMHGSLGGYQEYEVIRAQDAPITVGDCTNWRVKIIQTSEAQVVEHLEEHGVPHEREWDTVVLERSDARCFLGSELSPGKQNMFIGDLTDHPTARVEGYMTDTENKTIEVEYTHIPGL